MRLQEIKILREDYKEEIKSLDDVVDLLKRHCSDALKTIDKPIVRGMTDYGEFVKVKGEDGARKSQNTSNHYTMIMDAVLPSEFPRRSKSIICANYQGEFYAGSFGTVYAIFPYNGVKIGVCPGRDIWRLDIRLGETSDGIVAWNNKFGKMNLDDQNYDNFISGLSDAIEDAQGEGIAYELRDIQDLDKTIREAYSKPFKVADTAHADIYNDGITRELWIGGSCIAVRMDALPDVVAKLEE